jgi:predicted aldo/keto reductase-like oxidoreductase
MNAIDQLKENIKIAREGRPNSLLPEELALIDRVTERYKKMLKIDCTACAYCMPCQHGVNIPQNFRLYNDLFMFKDTGTNFFLYNRMLSPEQRAANCSECGECEERCPQHIKIVEELKKVHTTLAE